MLLHAFFTTVMFLAVLAQSQAPPPPAPPAAQRAIVSAEDLAVIDAALNHKTRNALNLAKPRGRVLMLDRTLEPCANERSGIRCFGYGEKTTLYVQRTIREITKAHIDALVARNAVAQFLPSAPAKDVLLVAREKLRAAMEQYDANVIASTSLPAYLDDGTALLFLEFSCGGHCGEGNFILLKRGAEGWRVKKAAITWIS
ncbi:MAG: hypothetical protein WD690_10035 [Vicinamibacterales bacterium]